MSEQTNKNLGNLIKEIQDQNLKSFLLQGIIAKSTAETAGPDDDAQKKIFDSIDKTLKEIKEQFANGVVNSLGGSNKKTKDKKEEETKRQDDNQSSLMDDTSEFFKGMKDGFKDTASYILGIKKDKAVLPKEEEESSDSEDKSGESLTDVFKSSFNKLFGEVVLLRKVTEGRLKFDSKSTSSAQYRNAAGQYVKAGSERIKDNVHARVTKGTTIFDKVDRPATVASGKVDNRATVASGKVENRATVASGKVENRATVASGKVDRPATVASGKVDRPATVAPLTASTEDVKEKYSVEGVLTRQQDLQQKEREIAAASSSGAGGGLLDVVLPGKDKDGKKSKPKGKGRALKGFRGKMGMGILAGGTVAVAGGAYTAYSGFSDASAEEKETLATIDQQVEAGEILPAEAEKLKSEVVDQTDVKQGSAVGEGAGVAAGGIAGMKAGALLGTALGPVGTVVGGVVGGAAGAFLGSKAGEAVGEYGTKAYKGIKGFFGGKNDAVSSTTTTADIKGVTSDQIMGHPNYQKYLDEAIKNSGDTPNKYRNAERIATSKVKADMVKEGGPGVTNKKVDGIPVTTASFASAGTMDQITPVTSSMGAELQKESMSNKELTTASNTPAAAAPIISNSVNNNETKTFVPMTPMPRASGTSFERYQDRTAMG